MGDIPILSDSGPRRESIINDTPAIFNIKNNPNADPHYGGWRTIPMFGRSVLHAYDSIIIAEANAQGVGPDLVRSIMYVENAQGFLDRIPEAVDLDTSLRPMNIRPTDWAGLSGIVEDVDEDDNSFELRDNTGETIDVHTSSNVAVREGEQVRVSGTMTDEALGMGEQIVSASVQRLR